MRVSNKKVPVLLQNLLANGQNKRDTQFNAGYIAITATIFLSLLIMVIAITLGNRSILSHSSSLEFNFKKASFQAAQSCLDHALLRLASNSQYAGNETITISGTSIQCHIYPIENLPSNAIIKVQSQLNKATTNLKLTVQIPQLSTISLEEMANF